MLPAVLPCKQRRAHMHVNVKLELLSYTVLEEATVQKIAPTHWIQPLCERWASNHSCKQGRQGQELSKEDEACVASLTA